MRLSQDRVWVPHSLRADRRYGGGGGGGRGGTAQMALHHTWHCICTCGTATSGSGEYLCHAQGVRQMVWRRCGKGGVGCERKGDAVWRMEPQVDVAFDVKP